MFIVQLDGLHVASPATILPDGFEETLYLEGLANPTSTELSPKGRLFVAEQLGNLKVIEDGEVHSILLTLPFTNSDPNERGLMGVAFDPDFENNGHVYVYYTRVDGSATD